jgi:tetratricopeptide (TPR) repeat protein
MLENELQDPSITEENRIDIYGSLCRALFGLKHYKEAIPYLLLSLEYSETQKDSSDMVAHLNNLGNAYYEIGELDSALTILNHAKNLNETVKNQATGIALTLTIAMVNHTKSPTKNHIDEFKSGLQNAIQGKWYPYALEAAEYLHDYYKKEVILDSAYTYLLLQNQLKDSLNGDNIRLQAIENKIEYEEERYKLLIAKGKNEAQLY